MCPFCMASAALLAGSVLSASGLTALVVKKLGAKKGIKNLFQKSNPKEETWAK
jgi:hypothetical protein